MKTGLLGPLLCLALLPAPSFAQAAPPPAANLPAQPIPVTGPLPPPIDDTGPETDPVIELPKPDKPADGQDKPASVKNLWRYGDGGEYLLWYIKGSRVPPLLVGNGGGGGLLPRPRALFGDATIDMQDRSGGLFTLSLPLNEEQTFGFHATYFFLGSREVHSLAGGNGGPDSPFVGRPYVDAATGAEAVRTVAAPDFANGFALVSLSSRLQGVEANGVANALGGEHYQIDLLAGFRFLQLAEGLAVLERESYLGGAGDLAGTTFAGEDRISTNTRFYGGQVGSRLEYRCGGAFMNVTGKLAFGDSIEVVRYSGTSITGGPASTTVLPTGNLFSLRSNLGRYAHESFGLLPELSLRVGWDLSDQARFFVGYSLLYLSDAVRPGDQIDRTVNTALVPDAAGHGPGPNRPGAPLRSTDFWAQGLTLGLEYSY